MGYIRKNFSWYYDLERVDVKSGDYEILDIKAMYSKLGKAVASDLYVKLRDYMLDFAHSEKSDFYGDYPTVWEQLKADERLGDPPLNEYQLESCCYKWLTKLNKYELYLLWIYACSESDNMNISMYDERVENIDFKDMIFRIILDEIYREAERENESYYDE